MRAVYLSEIKQKSQNEHEDLIQSQIEQSIDRIYQRLSPQSCDDINSYPAEESEKDKFFKRLFSGHKSPLPSVNDKLDQPPEFFVKQNIVWPILDILGYSYAIEARLRGKNPDFLIKNVSQDIFGEIKSFNKHDEARDDLSDYLDLSGSNVGMVTDGLYWQILRKGSENEEMTEITKADLRGVAVDYAERENLDLVRKETIKRRNNHKTTTVAEFYNRFNKKSIDEIL